MKSEIEQLKEEIRRIKSRNAKVESDKLWETSGFRKGTIALLTYILMVLTMSIISVENPFFSAIIPSLGFVLSTLTLGFIKKWWLKNRN